MKLKSYLQKSYPRVALFVFRVLLGIVFIFCISDAIILRAQTLEPLSQQVTIVRDSWGVPHIYGKTDPAVAFGLAWAHAEDDFKSIQENILAGQGRLGEVLGKKGVLLDFALYFFSIDTLVDRRFETDLSPAFRAYIEAYTQGLNAYAKAHPEEVLLKKALPFHAKDVIKGSIITTTLMSGVGLALKAINDEKVEEYLAVNDVGSNAAAIAPIRTDNGRTWLLVNSHQPMEGRYAWYEAHLSSEEGWNILGGLFPGGASIFVGVNEHLGWAHTVNYHNFGDIYLLKLNPKNAKSYELDGNYLPFNQRKVKLKVKLGCLKIGVKRTLFSSVHGPVFKKKKNYYALRYPGYQDIRATEQWYQMNKATDLESFEKALKMEALPLFNTLYADKKGNIFMLSDGKYPARDKSLNWRYPLPGDDSRYIWHSLLPYEMKPRYLNPSCGFLFNANNTPMQATCETENQTYDFVGVQKFGYNRGDVWSSRMNAHQGKFTQAVFHDIKYDLSYHTDGNYIKKFKQLYRLDPVQHPKIQEAISQLRSWDLKGDINSTGASVAKLAHHYLAKQINFPFAYLMIREQEISEKQAVEALTYAQHWLKKRYGRVDVPLGTIQRHIRGSLSLPVDGLSEVNRAMDSKMHDERKGIFRAHGGDGFIMFIEFDEQGPISIRTISAYGASSKPNSSHYTDQMHLFVDKKTKGMSLIKAQVYEQAERIYHPDAESVE